MTRQLVDFDAYELADFSDYFEGDEELLRVDDTLVHKALANTLSHADHDASGSIVVERHSKHFFFSNPGRLRLSRELLFEGGESDPRNPIIHKLFMRLKVTEQAGSGFPKILKAWKENHWRLPSMEGTLERTKLTLKMESLFSDAEIQRVQEAIGEAAFAALSSRERIIMVTVCLEERVSRSDLHHIVDMHPSDLSVTLRQLVEHGHLRKFGRSRGTFYELNTAHSEPSSLLSEGSSTHNDVSSLLGEPSSLLNGRSWEELQAVSEERLRGRKRVAPDEMRALLISLCRSPLSLQELSELTKRSRSTLQNKYLRLLIQDRSLSYVKSSPTHPEQRYVSTPRPTEPPPSVEEDV